MVAVLILGGVLGCSADQEPSGEASPRSPDTPPTSSPAGDPSAEHEIRGQLSSGSLWARFYHLRSGRELKTLWRVTGSSDITVTATGPDGQVLEPEWGPEAHTDSNWNRPGQEWGAGWVIPKGGRWVFTITRADGSTGTVAAVFSSWLCSRDFGGLVGGDRYSAASVLGSRGRT